MQRWYYERFKELLDLLKGFTENGKPLLDSMLVVYIAELYTPWNHVAYPSVAWTVGNAAGALASPGRYLDYGNQNDHNQVVEELQRTDDPVTLDLAVRAGRLPELGTQLAAYVTTGHGAGRDAVSTRVICRSWQNRRSIPGALWTHSRLASWATSQTEPLRNAL